jgi:Xaa-Pro aminopeptidase
MSKDHDSRLSALRTQMKNNGVDAYLVPRADEYQNEFVAPHAERLKYLTGFSGSAGLGLVMMDRAILFTDARYTEQAANEISANDYEIVDIAKTAPKDWMIENLCDTAIGYDPNLITIRFMEGLKSLTTQPLEKNLIDEIWSDQPRHPAAGMEIFSDSIAGKTAQNKIKTVCKTLRQEEISHYILNTPASVAWLLNIRARDIQYIPAPLCTAIIDIRGESVTLFSAPRPETTQPPPFSVPSSAPVTPVPPISLSGSLSPSSSPAPSSPVSSSAPSSASSRTASLPSYSSPHRQQGLYYVKYIEEADQQALLTLVSDYCADATSIGFDYASTPVMFQHVLSGKAIETHNITDPCSHPRSLKTLSEQDAIQKAHTIDGAAIVRFLRCIEQKGKTLDEVSAGKTLLEFRAEHSAFQGPSFPTICGLNANGALIHYRAMPESHAKLEQGGLLLVDSGGQYYDSAQAIAGTTDITRTVVLGDLSPALHEEVQGHYTRVLKGHIAVAQATFPAGTTGAQIDALARQPLWEAGLDYAHGTGHGVGCYLAVHEDAANLSPRSHKALEPGMLLSNEPGYYKSGSHGIRLENLVFVKKTGQQDSLGRDVLGFRDVTLAPFELDLIDDSLLDKQEIQWLNTYHTRVFETLSDHLDGDEIDWLRAKTVPIE